MRALLVEDEPQVASFVKKGLGESGFAVDVAADGEEGAYLAKTVGYDVVILDIMLPKKDGFAVLRDVRSAGITTPILCLTARDGIDDRVLGLNAGADDYLPKPFSFAELVARVRALLRRGRVVASNPLTIDNLVVDVLAHTVHRGGRRIDLSPNEFSLLEYLARNTGTVLSRTMILEHVWDMHQDPMTNVIDVHINRLRKKIDAGSEQPLIHTIRGVGYVLRTSDA